MDEKYLNVSIRLYYDEEHLHLSAKQPRSTWNIQVLS